MVYKFCLKKLQGGSYALLKILDDQCIDMLICRVSNVFELKFDLNVIPNIFLEGKKGKKRIVLMAAQLYKFTKNKNHFISFTYNR